MAVTYQLAGPDSCCERPHRDIHRKKRTVVQWVMGAVLGRDGGTDESMFPQFGITLLSPSSAPRMAPRQAKHRSARAKAPRKAEKARTKRLRRIAQLDQRTALPDQCLHSAEADVRLPRRKSGFDPNRTSGNHRRPGTWQCRVTVVGRLSRLARQERIAIDGEFSRLLFAAGTFESVDGGSDLHVHEADVFKHLLPGCTRQTTGIHAVQRSTLRIAASGTGFPFAISANCKRPPGRKTR